MTEAVEVVLEAAVSHTDAAPVRWALEMLNAALIRRGVELGSGGRRVRVLHSGDAAAIEAAASAGVTVRETKEAFALLFSDDDVLAIASDARGFVYALTELADRADNEPELFGPTSPVVEQPATRIRSITRMFCNEKEDKAWFHDKSHWIDYLNMLASNRFNRFSLTLGIQYDYPYHNHIISDVYLHFPYPYLVDLPGYDIRVQELSVAERRTNLEMLKFIGREAARRGLDFQLGLWTQRYDFDDVPYANYTVLGVTDDNLAPYCRDSIAFLLKEVPEITGLTFRIHVEGGISEGDYDFWRTAFDGIKSAGRQIEIDMHAKGLDETTLNVALETGMPVSASPKYLAEHVGLSYHTSAIREREYPPKEEMSNREKLSVGSRRFLRQSYGDLLPKGKPWRVTHRVWPGTQRILAWGDPALAAGYGRSASFCGSDGIEWMEPMSFKGRQGTGIPGGRVGYKVFDLATRLEWQKYEYQYRLWGRMSYNPDADPAHAQRWLHKVCGDVAPEVIEALSGASKVLPLVTHTHGPSIANNGYWPEIYTNLVLVGDNPLRPYGFDMDAPIRFGNAPTFDPQMFANAREYVETLLEGGVLHKYSPLDIADWLEGFAERTELAAFRAKGRGDLNRPASQRLLIDARVAAGIGRFFAAKQRGACWAELFLVSGDEACKQAAIDQLRRGREAWNDIVAITRDVYQDDLTFGPGAHLRGNWAARAADVERELKDLIALSSRHQKTEAISERSLEAARSGLTNRRKAVSGAIRISAEEAFERGKAFKVTAELPGKGRAVLHYRRVNQAERWRSAEMSGTYSSVSAEVPADYTDSPFHLQYYVTNATDEGLHIAPGLTPELDNRPYAVAKQA